MCGIVGLFLKDKALEPELGRLTAAMLHELCDRGPDSAGFAVYGGKNGSASKICAVRRSATLDWDDVTTRLQLRNRSHAVAYALREGLI